MDFQGSLGKVSSSSVQHPRQMVDLIMHLSKAYEQVRTIPFQLRKVPRWIEKLVCFEIIPLLSDLLVVLGKVSLVPSCPHAFVHSIINWDQREAFYLETFKLHLLAIQLVTWVRSVLCVVVCISFPLTKYDFPLDFWISFHLLTLMNFYLMMM